MHGHHLVVSQGLQSHVVSFIRIDAEARQQLKDLHLHQTVVGVQHCTGGGEQAVHIVTGRQPHYMESPTR